MTHSINGYVSIIQAHVPEVRGLRSRIQSQMLSLEIMKSRKCRAGLHCSLKLLEIFLRLLNGQAQVRRNTTIDEAIEA